MCLSLSDVLSDFNTWRAELKSSSVGSVSIKTKSSSLGSISFIPNQVLWARFPLYQTESFGLDLQAYVDSLSTSAAGAMGKSSAIYSIYNPKIKSNTLDLLDTKIVSNLG